LIYEDNEKLTESFRRAGEKIKHLTNNFDSITDEEKKLVINKIYEVLEIEFRINRKLNNSTSR